MSTGLSFRRSIKSVEQDQDQAELNKVRNAFRISMGIRDNRGYGHIAGFHGVPDWYCWHHQISIRTTVRPRIFLQWHRAYLYWLELHLKELARDPAVTIPYWVWTREESENRLPTSYESQSVDNQPNPLYKFHIDIPSAGINQDTNRVPGRIGQLPTKQQIDSILDISDFEDFEVELADIHDYIHGWVGGTMSNVGLASYDPIFYAHHCMIDRIWYLWQLKHGESAGMEQMLDIPLAPFDLNVKDVLNIRRLGYEYADVTRSMSVSAAEIGA